MTLARQLYPENQRYFIEAYNDACNIPYGYLLVDLAPDTDDKVRLRTNVFPGQVPFAYLPKF